MLKYLAHLPGFHSSVVGCRRQAVDWDLEKLRIAQDSYLVVLSIGCTAPAVAVLWHRVALLAHLRLKLRPAHAGQDHTRNWPKFD